MFIIWKEFNVYHMERVQCKVHDVIALLACSVTSVSIFYEPTRFAMGSHIISISFPEIGLLKWQHYTVNVYLPWKFIYFFPRLFPKYIHSIFWLGTSQKSYLETPLHVEWTWCFLIFSDIVIIAMLLAHCDRAAIHYALYNTP